MYLKLQEEIRNQHPTFPTTRRPLVGSVIKEMRIDKGIRQDDFAKMAKINLSTLKSIENDHQQATTVANINCFAQLLDLKPEDLILYGREWDPANHFVVKKTSPPKIHGLRKWKRAPEAWTETKILKHRNFEATPISAPIMNRKDFLFFRLLIPPKQKIDALKLPSHEFVIGFMTSGFNLQVTYAGQTRKITGNQGFSLDGFFPHSFKNLDEDSPAVLYIMTKLTIPETPRRHRLHKSIRQASHENMNISDGIQMLRHKFSNRPGSLISVQHLADLTDNLDHEQIGQMMRLKKGSSVVYWEKIEDLLGATNIAMDQFLTWCNKKTQPHFSIATAKSRARVEYPNFGAHFYSASPSGLDNRLYCGQLLIDGKGTIKQDGWMRKDNAMVGLFVEEGELEIAVGQRRSVVPLSKGESIYFDGALGYQLRNPNVNQLRAFFASFPGIQF